MATEITSLGDEMKKYLEAKTNTNSRLNDSESPSAEPRCLRCDDVHWVRLEVPVGDPRFGRALPCPDCMGGDDGFATWQMMPGTSQAYALARQFAAGTLATPWLVLVGDVGTGKTHLARAIKRAWQLRLRTVSMESVPTLLDNLRAGYGEDTNPRVMLAEYLRADLLILDDLGKGKVTEWVQEIIYRVVNERYQARAPLVVTTNLTIREVAAKYDAAVASRLWEVQSGLSTVTLLDAADYRTGQTW